MYAMHGRCLLERLKLSDTFDDANREAFRPFYHHTPVYGWMNDPNGMFYKDGEYHLYYQYNPYGSMWGNMNWGHSSSKDLISWQHHPVAIQPNGLGAVFSGSSVVDKDNTAGFGKDAIIAIYTSAGASQIQSLAYSLDNGMTSMFMKTILSLLPIRSAATRICSGTKRAVNGFLFWRLHWKRKCGYIPLPI